MKYRIPEKELLDIAEKLAEGKSYDEVAGIFFVEAQTVRTRMRNFRRREECANDLHLIAKLMKQNRINPAV